MSSFLIVFICPTDKYFEGRNVDEKLTSGVVVICDANGYISVKSFTSAYNACLALGSADYNHKRHNNSLWSEHGNIFLLEENSSM